MYVLPERSPPGAVSIGKRIDGGGSEDRWVFDDTNAWYPAMLRAGQRVSRGHDLRLARAILRHSALTSEHPVPLAPIWDDLPPVPLGHQEGAGPQALFALDGDDHARRPTETDMESELARQVRTIDASEGRHRLRMLIAAESAGALAAAEMHHAGLPWRADEHDRILTEALGPRPRPGDRPPRLEELAEEVRRALDAPGLNPDSPSALLRALQYAGLAVHSTNRWELRHYDHQVVGPLLEYKKLSRLASANGWSWLDSWVRDGRFHMPYVVGGVVTGRWATQGGGALQLPKAVRGAVIADDGWQLVVADAAQLEPRVLAGLSRDERMAAAGAGGDMYEGIVATGAVESRIHAKIGLLGAMYGGTTGDSALVLPRLSAAFPQAFALVESAARAGERGEIVSTRWGRSSPRPGPDWRETQEDAFGEEASDAAQSKARSQTRAWGRFTRNFVVQGTAAEWALAWMAGLRRKLWDLGEAEPSELVAAPFTARPHLAFFLHDEVIVHTPRSLADDVVAAVRESAAEAGRLLFPGFPIDFPLSVAVVTSYDQAGAAKEAR